MENIENRQDDEVLVLEVSSEDEARSQAAAHWGLPEDEILLKVVEEEKSFFGLFGRKLRVEARPAYPLQIRSFMALLEKVLDAAWLRLDMNVQPDGVVNLSGPDTKILLGKHGDGLKALDYLVNLMARNDGPAPRIRLDCDGFRRHREKDLERIALSAAKDAMKTRRTVYLEPMSSWERRIVHLTLKESTNVETHSIGVEPGRKVAIRPIVGSKGPRRQGPAPSREDRPRSPRPRSEDRRSNRPERKEPAPRAEE